MAVTVLFVEDDRVLGENVKKILCDNEYNVFMETSVGGAINTLNSDKMFDMALIDINLPDGDGFEICQIIVKHFRKAELLSRIITISDGQILE